MNTKVPALACLVAVRGAKNELKVIGLGRDDGLPYLISQNSQGVWEAVGRIAEDGSVPWSTLAAGYGSSNNLEVIGLGRDDGLPYRIFQDSKTGDWSASYGRLPNKFAMPWSTLGLGPGNWNNLQVIGLGRDDALPYLIWQDYQTGEWDGSYGSLPNDLKMPMSTLAVGQGNWNNLQVVGLGRDDGLPYLIWLDYLKGTWDGSYRALPNEQVPWRTLAIGRGNWDNLQVIGLGRDDDLPYLIWQDNKTGEWSGGYGRLVKEENPIPWSTLTTVRGFKNDLQVIGVGRDDGLLYLISQDSQGAWSPLRRVKSDYDVPWSTLAAARGYSDNLQVIGLGRDDGLPYLISQDAKTGNWDAQYGILPLGIPETQPFLEPGEVVLYSEEKHAGRLCVVQSDRPNLDRYFSPVNSIQIGPETSTTIYSEKGYQGLSQGLAADLGSFSQSALKGAKPKSIQVRTGSQPFTGYWVVEVVAGRYLSVRPDPSGVGVLHTDTNVRERQAFRIADRGEVDPERRLVEVQVRGKPFVKPTTAELTGPLTIDSLETATLMDEQALGYRKFSLLVQDKWVCYQADQDIFVASDDADQRTIFLRAVKIAEDEKQVGEILRGEVALFEQPSYWGKAWVFHADCSDFRTVEGLDNAAGSVQVGPLTGATLYSDKDYSTTDPRAGKQDVAQNIPSLADTDMGKGKASSLRIWHIIPPGEAGISVKCSLSQDFHYSESQSGKTQLEEYTAYRSTIQLPPDVTRVQVWATDRTEIEVEGKESKRVTVDEDHYETLEPNAISCLVITTNAMTPRNGQARPGSLCAPALKIRTNSMRENERVIIYPDQVVHERLATMENGELFNAEFTDDDGAARKVFKTQNQKDVDAVQGMIKTTMSTVKYSQGSAGAWERTLAPEALPEEPWALDFGVHALAGGPESETFGLEESGSAGIVFREMDRAEFEALLRVAQPQNDDLAQGFFSFFKHIGEAVADGFQVVVSGIKEGVCFLVRTAKDVLSWVVDTAEQVVAFVEALLDKIGAAIEEIIKWLRFLLDWDDIMDTRNFLRTSIRESFDRMVKMARQAKEPVKNFFESGKHIVTDAMDEAIEKLGGASGSGERSSGGMPDALQWFLSKIMSSNITIPLFEGPSVPGPADARIVRFWNDTLTGTLEPIMETVNDLDLTSVVTRLMKKPDEPQLVVADLLAMLRDQVVRLLDVGETITLGFLDVAADVVERFKEFIEADIYIPLLSDLLNWLHDRFGIDLRIGFSILDVVTLVLAIPVTIIHKVMFHTAPFKNASAQAFETGAQTGCSTGLTIFGAVCDFVGGLVNFPLDMTLEKDTWSKPGGQRGGLDTWLEMASIICAVGSWRVDLEEGIDEKESATATILAGILAAFETILVFADFVAFAGSSLSRKKGERLKRTIPSLICFSSVLGVIHVALTVVKDAFDKENDWLILPDIVGLLPEVVSFLRLPQCAKPPYTTVGFAAIDILGGTTCSATRLVRTYAHP